MEFKRFKSGNNFSIGVELELRVLDKTNLLPINEYEYIISNIDKKFKNNITKEFLDSMLEINTPVFYDEKQLILYLKEIISNINGILKNKNLLLQTNGTYAQKCTNINISDNKRYKEIYDEHKALLKNFSICGTHVHIGFKDFEKALKAYNYSIYYLPLFVALSASSIYYDGEDTGIHSFRTKIFERLPKASIPEYFDTFEQMQNLYNLLEDSEVINSTKDVWWDVRIQPELKTLEFRVCDASNDFDRLELIITLFKLICKLSQNEELIKMPMQILKQNLWSATRYSMDGKMITKNGVVKIRKMLKDIIKKGLEISFYDKQSYDKAIKIVEDKSISQQMIELYKETKDLKKIEELGVFK
ncbi:YbdK family carboxylate-amine ligase [Halarcobacter sp.]|uniref:carboxylate-amine ligase n=1 Tax=Halarcobacter sp. TaxID=2321133 RepID=UPI002AA6B5F8|nr:YbdK family carboxylate-amine ligase [Halarcobacter sp.]